MAAESRLVPADGMRPSLIAPVAPVAPVHPAAGAPVAGAPAVGPGTEACPILIARTSVRSVARCFVRSQCHARPMPRTSAPGGLADLLEKQLAVVSRGQLLKLGMSDRAMQYPPAARRAVADAAAWRLPGS